MSKPSIIASHRLEPHTLADLISRVWKQNPKRHALVELRESLGKFGYGQPILIDDTSGQIVDGHGVLAALLIAQEDGEAVPSRVHVQDDGEWVISCVHITLDAEQARAYSLSASRTIELGGWDDGLLLKVLTELQEQDALAGTGSHAEDITALQAKVSGEMPASFTQVPEPDDDPTQPKTGKQVKCPHCGKEFTA